MVSYYNTMIRACSMSDSPQKGLLLYRDMRRRGIAADPLSSSFVVKSCIRTRDALSLFDVLQNSSYKCEPDDVTCLLLLQACAHLYALEFGERIHGYMMEHGYGGSGIRGPVPPESRISKRKREEEGLSWGHWEKVAEVRKLMKNKSIQTTPGCSTIELKGVVHEFVVDDVSHTRNHEIYETLDEINHQLRIAGYVVELSSELHKMDDKEKGYVLSHHSEKLAIAFGVLATPPGTTLRVANNLRICVDCFNFLKHFSGVYNGDVILRDHNRFHHFRGGCCSCSNYW
ncbi:Pentatricopeptide repeat-containing protein [Glycine soja]